MKYISNIYHITNTFAHSSLFGFVFITTFQDEYFAKYFAVWKAKFIVYQKKKKNKKGHLCFFFFFWKKEDIY